MSDINVLSKGPKIVVIGGGTGLSVLLRGLKKYTSNITAIVTVADDGGGSGVLREDLGMLPPGDIRSCILALANTEPSMENLLQFRFSDGKLKGQSFGNLLLAAMNEMYGSFEMAIKEMSNVLAVTGKVLPMTLEDVNLRARLLNGHLAKGESDIPNICIEENTSIDRMYTEPNTCYPLKEAIRSIERADLIVLGPGSLYTSVIPNLLMVGMVDAISDARAHVAYITNVMTQPGETTGYSVSDHVDAIIKHSKNGMLDYVIANTEEASRETLERYNIDGAELVRASNKDKDYLEALGIELVTGALIDIEKDYIRHDSLELSEILIDLAKTKVYHR